MILKRLKRTVLVFCVLIISSAGIAQDKINGAGASFPAPLYYNWAYAYGKVTKNRVNYQSIGSGGGIRQVSNRIVDFGASDKPLDLKALEKNRLLQFPAVIGSIVVAHHIPGIPDEVLKLKNRVVADIFSGNITRWNDPRITADNPDLKLPDEHIVVVHRSDGSGTTYNFTYYLNESSRYWRDHFGVGKAIDWAVGLGGKGNEGIANLVKQTPYAIGYIENAYKENNGLAAATLQTADGTWVSAREANFKAAAGYANWSKENSFSAMLVLQPGAMSYPIVAATFILLPKEKTDKNKKIEAFFDYAFTEGDDTAVKLGYIPLPDGTKALIRAYWSDHIQ